MTEQGAGDEGYVLSPDGRVTFTAEGRAFYASYFGYAGIDIRTITTIEQLDAARHAAFPVLFEYMAQRLHRQPQTLEVRALLAVMEGDWDSYARAARQLETRERLAVIDAASGVPRAPD